MLGYHKKEVRNRVIREIWKKGPLTRLQIEKISGLSNSYNHKLIKFLLQKEVIHRENGSILRGRRPYFYSVSPRMGYFVGAEIDDNRIIIMISDFSLTPFKKFSHATKVSPPTMIEDTARLIRQSIDDCGVAWYKVRGIGLGLHGIVDFSSRTLVKFHHTSGLVNISVKEGLERKLNKIPVFIEDNNRASVLAEKKFGQAKNVENFLYVRVSSGVGMGIWINGECYRGDTSLAGEIGHIIVDRSGSSCYCGNFGCLETFVSNNALCRLAEKRLKKGVESKLRNKWTEGKEQLEISDIVNAGIEGDKLAYGIIREAGEILGHVLAMVVNILNVNLIILDGELIHAGDIFMYPLRQVVRSEAIQESANHVRIIFSKLGDESVVRGALALCLNEILQDPSKYIIEKVKQDCSN